MPTPPTVLLADDEVVCLNVITAMLKHFGVRVITAIDGVEALQRYEEHGDVIDLVLLDIEMPRLNGVETLRRLRRLADDIRVVIVSGHVTPANRAKLDLLSPLGYIDKPFTLDHFRPFIEPLLPDGAAAG